MKQFQIVLFGLMICLACSSPKLETTASSVPIDSLFSEYHEGFLKLFPLNATLVGDSRYNHLLPNPVTLEYRNQIKDFYTTLREKLKTYDRSSLSENDKMSYDVLLWEADIALEGLEHKDHLLPINQFWAQHLLIGQIAGGSSLQPFKTAKDYDNWLSRLDSYVAWCDSSIVNMKKGVEQGYTLPTPLIEKTIPQFDAMDDGPVEAHLFYTPVKNFPAEISAEDKTRLTAAYKEMVEGKIIPAHTRVKSYLQNDYMKSGRTTAGISAIPNGKEYYQYLIKLYTTTNMTSTEIFQLGQSEVERISAEMEKVKAEVGFKGDLKSFFNHLRARKELMPFKKPEEVIANFNAIHQRMKPNLAKLFDKTPKSAFEVRRTEAFREASASAEYMPGSQDGSRPGVFYVPVPDVKKYNMLSDEDLFLHEAIPGHHYQIMLQMENTALPEFRRILNYSAYAEGWALYTESLGKELGLYTDPYQYFGMLSGEMHRAIRLVVDAGMHTQGWTREQAIQYSKDHEAESEESIIAEIERYMAIPGQALSYKVGQLKIRELRTRAEKELADKFKIAEFHNQILDSGCVPLQVLEGKIDRWIADVKSKG
jgi:uncharacterized protein (DUF885 family)